MEKGTITIRYMQEYLKRKKSIDRCENVDVCLVKIMEELGEFCHSWLRDDRLATGPDDLKGSLNEELYDMLYYLLTLANSVGVDLETWIPMKEKMNNERYPSGMVFDPDDESVYRE